MFLKYWSLLQSESWIYIFSTVPQKVHAMTLENMPYVIAFD